MNLLKVISFLFFFGIFSISFSANPENRNLLQNTSGKTNSIFDELTSSDILTFGNSEIESLLGRKLLLKEKIALTYVKRKLEKNNELSLEDAVSQSQMDGFAIAGFLAGIAGLIVFGIPLGIVALVLSSIALKRISKSRKTTNKRNGRGLAIAGSVLGIIDILGALIFLAMLA